MDTDVRDIDKPTNRQLVSTIFSPTSEDRWRCRICAKQRVQVSGKGYTNLIDHLQRAHSDATIDSAYKHILRHGTSIPVVNVSSVAKGIHGWIEWIVMENRPLSFCASELVRKNTTLPKISAKSLKGHIRALVEVVRSEIKAKLAGQRLGLVFDGWSENGYHFVATFAVVPSEDPSDPTKREVNLLSFKPHKTSNVGSDAIIDVFDDVLDEYDLLLNQLCFFVGDNASVNISVGKKVKVPLVGCASHRLHLAVERHLEPYSNLLDKVAAVVKCLRTGKQRAVLREDDLLTPLLRNDTRWSSTFSMVSRYLELAPHLDDSDPDLAPLVLTAADKNRLRTLMDELKKFESVSKKLQEKNGLTLRHVRVMFDKLISVFPVSCERHLSQNARIVAFPNFENGVNKILSGQESDLTPSERAAVRPLMRPNEVANTESSDEELTFAEAALSNIDIPAVASRYMNLDWIPPTSNDVERLFSQAGLVYSDRRQSMHPETLEQLLFLRQNRALWSEVTVAAILNHPRTPRKRTYREVASPDM